jgi:hypothetical protein
MTEPNPDAKARQREQRRQYYQANRAKILEQAHSHYVANRQKKLEAGKAYRAANADKIRERNRKYRAANADKIREQEARHRQANLEQERAKRREYYEANLEQVRARSREYYRANAAKVLDYKRGYHEANGTKIRQATLERRHGPGIAADWAAMWEAQQGRCYLCGRDMDPDGAHIEHWHGCPGHDPKKSCRACRRGLAHEHCNLVIGWAADDPSLLRTIADNLEQANADIAARQAVMPQHITLF